jgi:signal transduction histidine kinase
MLWRVPVAVTWTTELRQAFAALRAGRPARVAFDARNDRIGDLGREFNRLADDVAARGPEGFTREQAHALRNRLAGILAVLHVLRLTGASGPEEEEALAQVAADAKELDTRLRAG